MAVLLRASLLSLVLAAAGCASNYVSRGADLYAGGRYVEAAEVFERTELRLTNTSVGDRARYGLYRGATLLALGDTLRAQTWLGYSANVVREVPAALSVEEREMLTRALSLLASRHVTQPALGQSHATVAASNE